MSAIDVATNAVTATIPVGSDATAVAADPAARTVYVTNASDNMVSVINAATNTVTATIPVGSDRPGWGRTPPPEPSMWPPSRCSDRRGDPQ